MKNKTIKVMVEKERLARWKKAAKIASHDSLSSMIRQSVDAYSTDVNLRYNTAKDVQRLIK